MPCGCAPRQPAARCAARSGGDLEAAHELVELLRGAGELGGGGGDLLRRGARLLRGRGHLLGGGRGLLGHRGDPLIPPSARCDSAEISWTAPAISATRSVIDSTASPMTSKASRVCSTVATPRSCPARAGRRPRRRGGGRPG